MFNVCHERIVTCQLYDSCWKYNTKRGELIPSVELVAADTWLSIHSISHIILHFRGTCSDLKQVKVMNVSEGESGLTPQTATAQGQKRNTDIQFHPSELNKTKVINMNENEWGLISLIWRSRSKSTRVSPHKIWTRSRSWTWVKMKEVQCHGHQHFRYAIATSHGLNSCSIQQAHVATKENPASWFTFFTFFFLAFSGANEIGSSSSYSSSL